MPVLGKIGPQKSFELDPHKIQDAPLADSRVEGGPCRMRDEGVGEAVEFASFADFAVVPVCQKRVVEGRHPDQTKLPARIPLGNV